MLRIDNATLRTRVQKIQDDLRRLDLHALVLYANGSVLGNKSRMHGYLRYCCNYDGRNTPAMLIVRPDRAPTLITGNPNQGHNRSDTVDRALWFDDVRHMQAQLMGEEVVRALTKDQPAARRVAYMGYNETPAPVWKSMENGLPEVEWTHDFAAHFDQHRVRKTPLELTFHRRAAEVCDAMFQTLAREVKTGKTGYQLQAGMEYTARCEGCDYGITWLTVSPQADFSRFDIQECLRVPQTGDQVLAGIYIQYDGHWGHAIRTANIGQPTDEHRKIYGVVREMLEAALEKLRPGGNLHDVNTAMNRAWQKYYSEKDVRRSRPGHGLGYSYEDPIVSLAFPYAWNVKGQPAPAPIEIKPGMLMELHPQIWLPDRGGAMIGEMVAVTETGYEILTQFPNDLIVW
jgi:Xaa-Pro aminopeptidase